MLNKGNKGNSLHGAGMLQAKMSHDLSYSEGIIVIMLYQCNVLVVHFINISFITCFPIIKEFLEGRISDMLIGILEHDLKIAVDLCKV